MAHFLLNKWDFRNQKLLSLSNEVPPDNQQDFGFAVDLNYIYNYNTLLLYYK